MYLQIKMNKKILKTYTIKKGQILNTNSKQIGH